MAVLEEIIAVIIFLVLGFIAGIEMKRQYVGMIPRTVPSRQGQEILMVPPQHRGGEWDKANTTQNGAYQN